MIVALALALAAWSVACVAAGATLAVVALDRLVVRPLRGEVDAIRSDVRAEAATLNARLSDLRVDAARRGATPMEYAFGVDLHRFETAADPTPPPTQ